MVITVIAVVILISFVQGIVQIKKGFSKSFHDGILALIVFF